MCYDVQPYRRKGDAYHGVSGAVLQSCSPQARLTVLCFIGCLHRKSNYGSPVQRPIQWLERGWDYAQRHFQEFILGSLLHFGTGCSYNIGPQLLHKFGSYRHRKNGRVSQHFELIAIEYRPSIEKFRYLPGWCHNYGIGDGVRMRSLVPLQMIIVRSQWRATYNRQTVRY